MAEADEAAEQPVLVEVLGEVAGAAAAERVAAVPVGAGLRVERRAQPRIGLKVGGDAGAGEEVVEGGVVGQVAPPRQPEAVERDVMGVEVDRGDGGGIGQEVAHHVAAARGDGDEAVGRFQRQRLHVDLGILPDLGVDEAAEGQGEQPVLAGRARRGAGGAPPRPLMRRRLLAAASSRVRAVSTVLTSGILRRLQIVRADRPSRIRQGGDVDA